MSVLIAYHGIEAGGSPLLVSPDALARQLDALAAAGATALTVTGLVAALRAGELPPNAVALLFDDGYASVVEEAAPLLAERGLVATIYCIAGRLGGTSDWPTQPPFGLHGRRLATAAELAPLAAAGWEIGAHGIDHDPLDAPGCDVDHELRESKRLLEEAVGVPVTSFCFPYGAVPRAATAALERAGYVAACTTRLGRVGSDSHPLALPRVDSHYVRRPAHFAAVAGGRGGLYLDARRAAALLRRLAGRDSVDGASA